MDKGFSLRQKKSKRVAISGPKAISAPLTTSSSQTSVSSPPRARGNDQNTADLVKRRYSTRFNQLPDFGKGDLPPMPPVPKSSAKQAPVFSKQRMEKPVEASPIPVDAAALKMSHFQAESFANETLTEASDHQLREYQAALQKLKHRASTDLQQNVLQNRTQFIKISKEADKLKGEMRSLRTLMSELAVAVNVASVSAGIPEVKVSIDEEARSRARKQANRSSVANLEAMWSTQLHTLWRNVEGSQKFLPAVAGRHIVLEQGGWLELDAATWKTRRRAHMILLNDHLLVAVIKKRRVDPNAGESEKSRTQIVADKCWPLQDLELLDLATTTRDAAMMANAISLRCGGESFTYRSERSSSAEKSKLMQDFQRTADELRRVLRQEIEEHSQRRQSSMEAKVKAPIEAEKHEILIEVEGKHQNLQWLEAQIDELDSLTALQSFEEAVKQVEKLRKLLPGLKNHPGAQRIVSEKLDARADTLASLFLMEIPDAETICQHLSNHHAKLGKCQSDIGHLILLSHDTLAKTTYLDSRTGVIQTRVRSIVFEGDLRRHIFQLSYVYFTLMRNTVKTFQQCFPSPMMSACVRWCKDRLDDFNLLLSRQLSSLQPDSPTWQDCFNLAVEHASMMDEVGIDFRSLVSCKPAP